MMEKRIWLVNKRVKMNLTQKQIAKELNISDAAYCFIENGSRKPSVALAKKIGKKLNFKWTRFFEEEKEKV